MKTYNNIFKYFLLFSLPLFFIACSDDDDAVTEIPVETPATYDFSRDGQNTVSFSGQTARLNHVDALYKLLNYNTPNATDGSFSNDPAAPYFTSYADLNKMYSSGDFGTILPTLNGSGKNVGSKTAAGCATQGDAGVREDLRKVLENFATLTGDIAGHDATAASGSAGKLVYKNGTKYIQVDGNGHEFDQIFVKGLIGALTLDQIVNNYLDPCKLDGDGYRDNNDNKVNATGKSYTDMEHKWDEGFGYLYGQEADYTRADLGTAPLGNGNLLMKYFKKINADQTSGSKAGEPMGPIVFEAFKKGRAAIVAGNYEVRDQQAAIIKIQLSKIIGFKAVDYLNSYVSQMGNGDRGYAYHALSEGYGFIMSLQFTNDGKGSPYFTTAQVDAMLADISDFWALDDGNGNVTTAAKAKIDAHVASIKSAFGI